MIEQRSFVNHLCWFNESPLANIAPMMPVVTSPTFDASLKQLFAPLFRGAPLWILSDEVVSQPARLLDVLTSHSGERLDQDLVRRTFAAMPDIEIWNLYGPTEAAVNGCAGMVRLDSALTIGRPISNAQIYILEIHLHPVPVGVAGELPVCGDGLARDIGTGPS